MNTVLGLWFIAVGLIGVVRPTFFYRSEKLTPDQIVRNRRIWRWCGVGLIICGAGVLVVQLLAR